MRKKTIAMILVGVMLLSTTVVMAKSQAKNIQVYDSESTIYVDGSVVSFDSAPLVYNGTTYLPIRGVSDALGEEIKYNPTTKAIYIGMQPGVPQYMTEFIKLGETFRETTYYLDYIDKLSIYGKEYKCGYTIGRYGIIEFKLDGKYSEVTFDLGIRGSVGEATTLLVTAYRDNKEYKTYILNGTDDEVKKIEIPVTGTKILKIQTEDWEYGAATVGLGNPMIEWEPVK